MIVVSRAEPADAAALVALASAVSAEPEGWMIWSEWRGVGDERRYLRAVRGHPDAAVFVAELDGELAGRLSLARDQNPASHHVADLGLMVDERFRRRGIGRALLEAAVAWAPEHGVAKLELDVFPWNDGAIALYEAFGFEREGLRRRHYLRTGRVRGRHPHGAPGLSPTKSGHRPIWPEQTVQACQDTEGTVHACADAGRPRSRATRQGHVSRRGSGSDAVVGEVPIRSKGYGRAREGLDRSRT